MLSNLRRRFSSNTAAATQPLKPFWKQVRVEPLPMGEGFTVTLDGRPLKLPNASSGQKQDVCIPSQTLAMQVAAEWHRQRDVWRPNDLILVRRLYQCNFY